ncbi:AMP-binding protein [Glaciecola petra]|uniref:Long-chain-fatty-acid--CoA ligase n=1 Tax=Glaciecola petra TaxID=3075602 RepID=A0ABU2ZW25_9ALTE|nr:AMP-binding protein [Aestuariibacter sp. P117]MDT0596615.1 AMP-binding protein [Aestuariibacter sp. P117]
MTASNSLLPAHINGLADYIEETFKKYADRPAYNALGQSKSFAQMDELSAKFANYLLEHTELKPGDRIAVQLPNLIQHPIAVYGALRAGMVVVNTNPLYTPSEMQHQFNDSGAKALVILADLLPKYESIKADVGIEKVIVTSATQLLDEKPVENSEYDCYAKIFAMVSNTTVPAREGISLDDSCILQYTGGTTGVSKGAELSHLNVLANSIQTLDRVKSIVVEGEEIVVCPLPLYHIYAFTVCMMTFFAKGAMILLIPNPRDMDAFVNTLKPHQFTNFAGINTLFMGLCSHPEFKDLDFSKLKFTMSGGTALTSAAADLWKSTTGCSVSEGYGLSETAPVLAFNVPNNEVMGTVGPPLVETDIQFLDENDQPVAEGQEGQIAAKGPQVMKGYWQRPDETAKVMTTSGYFKTGDIGLITPEGCVKIVDRLKDMIIVSGFNVYPNEVEEVLCKHPDVLEAAVVGKADDNTQERVCAYITVAKDIDTAQVIAHCRESLTGYKVPKEINVIEELPKSSVGKILRRELRT